MLLISSVCFVNVNGISSSMCMCVLYIMLCSVLYTWVCVLYVYALVCSNNNYVSMNSIIYFICYI